MVQINFAQKQVNAKIVFYGPGMSGKTTNLEVIHQRAPVPNKGELTSISTDGDRTLFFDFMPLDLGTVAGMRTCFQIYTVPGQVYYNSTRKLVLQGVDGVVFVADSSASMIEENLESIRNLEQNLNEYGKSITSIPVILQYNKRDLPDAMPVEELNRVLNPHGFTTFEAVANTGQGVFPTLKALAAKVLESIHGGAKPGAPAAAPAAAAPQPAAPMASPAPQKAAPAPAPAPVGAGVSQTGFHQQPAAAAAGTAGRSLTQTAYQRGFQRPAAANPGLPPVPTFGPGGSLSKTTIQAPPAHNRPAPALAQPEQPQARTAQAPQGQGGLAMAQPNSPGLSMQGAKPAGGPRVMRPGSPAPVASRGGAPAQRSPGADRPAQPKPQARPAPSARSSARPAPAPVAEAPKKSKSLAYTMIFVLGAVGVGAIVAKVVFSMF